MPVGEFPLPLQNVQNLLFQFIIIRKSIKLKQLLLISGYELYLCLN